MASRSWRRWSSYEMARFSAMTFHTLKLCSIKRSGNGTRSITGGCGSSRLWKNKAKSLISKRSAARACSTYRTTFQSCTRPPGCLREATRSVGGDGGWGWILQTRRILRTKLTAPGRTKRGLPVGRWRWDGRSGVFSVAWGVQKALEGASNRQDITLMTASLQAAGPGVCRRRAACSRRARLAPGSIWLAADSAWPTGSGSAPSSFATSTRCGSASRGGRECLSVCTRVVCASRASRRKSVWTSIASSCTTGRVWGAVGSLPASLPWGSTSWTWGTSYNLRTTEVFPFAIRPGFLFFIFIHEKKKS